MTDTHTHLYMDAYEDGGIGVTRRAIESGVSMMIFPAVDSSTLEAMARLHGEFPGNTAIAIGLHPTELGEDWKGELDRMGKMLEENPSRYIAIGETGIDLYWEQTRREEQKEAFSLQYDWAKKYDKPLIIHCREGLDDTLGVISGKEGDRPVMIFHSFTCGAEDVKRIREVCDPYFGINGVVTFKNAPSLREALPEIGLDRIVLETDSPYLAPVPHRGTRNESAFLPAIRDKVAEVLGVLPEEVERITDINAKNIFRL